MSAASSRSSHSAVGRVEKCSSSRRFSSSRPRMRSPTPAKRSSVSRSGRSMARQNAGQRLRVDAADGHPAVGGAVGVPLPEQVGVAAAGLRRHLAGHQVSGSAPRTGAASRLPRSEVSTRLAAPVRSRATSAATMPRARVTRADVVGHGDARWAPASRLAGDAHEAAHRLRQDVVAGLPAEPALRAEGGGAGVDDAGVGLRGTPRSPGPASPSRPAGSCGRRRRSRGRGGGRSRGPSSDFRSRVRLFLPRLIARK